MGAAARVCNASKELAEEYDDCPNFRIVSLTTDSMRTFEDRMPLAAPGREWVQVLAGYLPLLPLAPLLPLPWRGRLAAWSTPSRAPHTVIQVWYNSPTASSMRAATEAVTTSVLYTRRATLSAASTAARTVRSVSGAMAPSHRRENLQRREAFQRETNRSITCTTAPQGLPTQRCAAHDCWRCLTLQGQQHLLTLNDRGRAARHAFEQP